MQKSCFKPPRSEDGSRDEIPCGVWGSAPSRFGRQPNVPNISKKEAVSEQNAEHPTIETGRVQGVFNILIKRIAEGCTLFLTYSYFFLSTVDFASVAHGRAMCYPVVTGLK